jgi:tRNA (cmo5U34)-methyltransferase
MSDIDGFNSVAKYYDLLKRLVFGNAIYGSQVKFIQALPTSGNILILGGGSGEILKPVLKLKPRCIIWYLEASSAMISIAKRQVPAELESAIHFIHGTEQALPAGVTFNGIVTHFFLDLFPNEALLSLMQVLSGRLAENGVWIVADFIDAGKWWQRLLLKAMYRFFVVFCRIEARALPHWEDQLRAAGLNQCESAWFYSGFIKSAVYQKKRGQN